MGTQITFQVSFFALAMSAYLLFRAPRDSRLRGMFCLLFVVTGAAFWIARATDVGLPFTVRENSYRWHYATLLGLPIALHCLFFSVRSCSGREERMDFSRARSDCCFFGPGRRRLPFSSLKTPVRRACSKARFSCIWLRHLW